MKRIFIAIKTEPGPVFAEILRSFRTRLSSESIKWVIPANLHITLAFLGDTVEDRIGALSEIIAGSCYSSTGFEILLLGAGVFKSVNDPRVLWVGIGPDERLQRLRGLIFEGLKLYGFKVDEKPFSPHLTIGRIRSINDKSRLKTLLEINSGRVIQNITVKEVILFESIPGQGGPVYKPLQKFQLKSS